MSREIETVTAMIKQAQADLLDLKNKQFVGTDNIKVYENTSGDVWDVDEDVTISAGIRIWAYFIADTQLAPFAEFVPEIRLNNVPYNTMTDTRLNDVRFGVDRSFLVELNPSTEEAKRLAYYGLNLSNSSYPVTINVKVKFTVLATDTGTVGAFV